MPVLCKMHILSLSAVPRIHGHEQNITSACRDFSGSSCFSGSNSTSASPVFASFLLRQVLCSPSCMLLFTWARDLVSGELLILGFSDGAGILQPKPSKAETMCSSILSEESLGGGEQRRLLDLLLAI